MDYSRFIIFLDVDGVICSYDENIYMPDMKDMYDVDEEHFFKSDAIDALNTIVEHYDADLCMISSWNGKFKDEEHYKTFLVRRGVKVNNLYFGNKHDRANCVIENINNGMTNYIIIDDEAHQYYKRIDKIAYLRILKPDRNRCLDKYDAKFVTVNLKLKK